MTVLGIAGVVGRGVGQSGLRVVPIVGLVLVDLGEQGVEALGVAVADHIGGDELAQSLQILGLGPRPALVGGRPGLIDVVGGLQVGKKTGVDAHAGAFGAGRAARARDGVNDVLLGRGLRDAENSAGASVGTVVATGAPRPPGRVRILAAHAAVPVIASRHGLLIVPWTGGKPKGTAYAGRARRQ